MQRGIDVNKISNQTTAPVLFWTYSYISIDHIYGMCHFRPSCHVECMQMTFLGSFNGSLDIQVERKKLDQYIIMPFGKYVSKYLYLYMIVWYQYIQKFLELLF